MIMRLVALAVAGFALLHAYFYVAFGSFDPCTAATFRLMNKDSSGQSANGSPAFSSALDEDLRSRGLLVCYRTAVTGDPPEGLF
jgi:hypothetical protein